MSKKYVANRQGICRNCGGEFTARNRTGLVPMFCYEVECQYARRIRSSEMSNRAARARRRNKRIRFNYTPCDELCPAWQECRMRVQYKLPIVCGDVQLWDVDKYYIARAEKQHVYLQEV